MRTKRAAQALALALTGSLAAASAPGADIKVLTAGAFKPVVVAVAADSNARAATAC
jgi:hypothetical protein